MKIDTVPSTRFVLITLPVAAALAVPPGGVVGS